MDDAATSGVAAVSSDAAATDVRQRRPAAELPLNPATAAAQPDAGIPETDAAEPVGDGNDASPDGGAASAEGVEPAEDVRACLFSLLQRKCPELRITCNALGMLEGLLDQIVQRVLAEALQEAGRGAEADPEPLTSLAIQKAVKKLLPNEQLPASALKNSWHLDKQSLRGIKRRRADHEAEVPVLKEEPESLDAGTEPAHQ